MSILSIFKHRIFLRIYAGLLIVCMVVFVFGRMLLGVINTERAQNYREDIATAVFDVMTEVATHQKNGRELRFWLSDADSAWGSHFELVSANEVQLTAHESNRLNSGLSVVRYSKEDKDSEIYHRMPNGNTLLTVKLGYPRAQQVRALGILLLDDLSYFHSLSAKRTRLIELSEKFPFPLKYTRTEDLDIDWIQLSRLRSGENVILFDEDTNADTTAIKVLIASNVTNMVIEMGPVPLFKWYPLNIVLGIVVLCMLFISLGVYALILPLERKLQLLQSGLNDVSEGKLDTRLQVNGEDETARLSATFNTMAEHIKRLIESQRELSRAVSHELRTPVARIRFAVDMLADTDDEESRYNQRDFIDEDIEALNSLIDEILTYAKLEEGSPKMNWEMVNLKDLVEQIVRETNALGKSIKVSAIPPSVRISAEADYRYLHRVVQNLAGNALRYADSQIIISAGVKKGLAFVSVEDDGQGIPEEDRDKVFIPFARLDDSRTRSSGGYGLGLSIVSRICFWLNGSMKVDNSESLGGAKFIMTWPVKQLTQAIAADTLTQEHNERKIILDTQN